jgi:hypothetical protein
MQGDHKERDEWWERFVPEGKAPTKNKDFPLVFKKRGSYYLQKITC